MPGVQFLEYEAAEGRIDASIHRQYPVGFAREAHAFYRILLGHEDRVGVEELEIGLRAPKEKKAKKAKGKAAE